MKRQRVIIESLAGYLFDYIPGPRWTQTRSEAPSFTPRQAAIIVSKIMEHPTESRVKPFMVAQ